MRLWILSSFFVVGLAVPRMASAIDIVTDKTVLPTGTCQKMTLFRPLNIYKDPTLFMSDLGTLSHDPKQGWKQMQQENPVLTQLQGEVQFVVLGPARPFKNFGAIARIYEAAEPRLKWTEQQQAKNATALVVPVQVCGEGAYNSTLGFVIDEDFKKAQQYDNRSASLPPSVFPNPVPAFPQTGSGR